MKVAVSFLKSKFEKNMTIQKIEESNADYIHVDAMDGVFVKESTLDNKTFIELLSNHVKPLDIHLMMDEKNSMIAIEELSILNPEYITVHVELNNTKELIELIKAKGIKPGLAIKPDTDISLLNSYIDDINQILVMSVYPGKGGQTFIEDTISRLEEISKIKNESIIINVDGGINDITINKINNLCDMVVSGSYICMSDDFNEQINKLK